MDEIYMFHFLYLASCAAFYDSYDCDILFLLLFICLINAFTYLFYFVMILY